MELCGQCLLIGYCFRIKVKLVTDDELANPNIVAGIRYQAAALKISHHSWPDKALDMYAQFRGIIVDSQGKETWLDTALLYEPAGINYWFRDFACTPVRPGQKIYVRATAWERTQVFATILRAHSPLIAHHWNSFGEALLVRECA